MTVNFLKKECARSVIPVPTLGGYRNDYFFAYSFVKIDVIGSSIVMALDRNVESSVILK